MKAIQTKTTMVCLFALVVLMGNTFAQKKTEKVILEKEFSVNENAVLQINHKYGEVTCRNHPENTIMVKVTAVYNAKDKAKFEKILDKFDVQVTGDEFKVDIKSDYHQKIEVNGSSLSVDVMIFMPETIRLKMNHMFGNANIETLSGKAVIDFSYGRMAIDALLHAENDVSIGFGKSTIHKIEGGKLSVSFADVEISEASDMQLNSEYSNLEISRIDSLRSVQEGGNLNIGTASVLNLNTKFTGVRIGELTGRMTAAAEYGSIKVEMISKGFSSVSLSNDFATGTLTFADGTNFDLEAEMNFCSLSYPRETTFTEKISSAMKSTYKGTFGNIETADALVSVKSNYGSVTIKTN
jgi:hypothetical protein